MLYKILVPLKTYYYTRISVWFGLMRFKIKWVEWAVYLKKKPLASWVKTTLLNIVDTPLIGCGCKNANVHSGAFRRFASGEGTGAKFYCSPLRNQCNTSIYTRPRSSEQELLYIKSNDFKFYAFYKNWINKLFGDLM